MNYADVVVVGAGPVGLILAGDLARAGRTVTVLERRPRMNPSSRAFATMARTLELLDSRELAEGLLATGTTTPVVKLFPGASLDLSRLPSRYPYALITPQTNVDQALESYARTQGAQVRRGVRVTGLVQDGGGVTITAQPEAGGPADTWRASYVVGADGAHSTVRDLLGVPFPGRTVLRSVVLADIKLTHGPAGRGLTLGSTPDAFGFLVPYGRADGDGAWFRSMTWDRRDQRPDAAPAGDAEIIDVLNRTMGHDVGFAGSSWRSRFHSDERQVPQYRRGRVFLAGDAAHVHSPMGGQGMNTGIQDAVNLAWKLDAVLGGAGDALLDTYQTERHPIGRLVLRQSGLMLRAITLRSRAARWTRDQVLPAVLRRRAASDAIAGRFAGVTLRYRGGPGRHRLVGTRAEQVPLSGTTIGHLLRTPAFLLVREKGTPALDTGLPQAERRDDGPALVVRPDGYVAWAGSTADGGWLRFLTGALGPRSSVVAAARRHPDGARR